MATTDPVLQEMIDEFALRRLVHAYCRAVDRGDTETLRNLYHHDAVDAHGGFSAGTPDQFLQQLTAARPYIRSMGRGTGRAVCLALAVAAARRVRVTQMR